MSYASLYWRRFMWGEEFSPQQRGDTVWVRELDYPDGGGVYNRYTLAYLWRRIILEAFDRDRVSMQHGSWDLQLFVGDLDYELFATDPVFRKEQKILQDATWQGYESKKELEDLKMLFYDLYDGDMVGLQWRIEDFYGIGLDLFFESTCFCYILQESQKTMFKFRNSPKKKHLELGNIYDLGSGPPWNGRVSFDVGPQELWFAYQAKSILMYSEESRESIFQRIIDLAQKTNFNYYYNSSKNQEKISVMKPSAANFDALMNFADNVFMGQVFYEDRWTRYHRPVQPLFFEDELYPIENGTQTSYIDAYAAARKATEDYLQQRRNFFDGVG